MASFRRTWLFSIVFVALAATPVLAQDSPANESPTELTTTESTEGSADPAPRTEPPATVNRLIYVPYRKLDSVFGQDNASAVIPWADYLKLLRQSSTRPIVDDSPQAILTKAEWNATVEQDVARIKATFTVNVLKQSGWAVLPLVLGDAAVSTIEISDSTLLQGTGQGTWELLLRGAGTHTVQLELLTSVSTSPEARSFDVHSPTAGISELQVTIPQGDQTVQVSPIQVQLPSEGNTADQTVVRAALGATNQFTVRWYPNSGSQPQMDLLSSVTNETQVRFESQLVQSTARLTWNVLRGELQDATVLVPPGDRIIDVTATQGRIQSWETTSTDQQQQIQIQLTQPVTGQLMVEVQTERDLQDQQISLLGRGDDNVLQGIHADHVIRESGQLVLSCDTAQRLLVKKKSGVRRISDEIRIRRFQTNGLAAPLLWTFSGQRSQLTVETEPVIPDVVAEQKAVVLLEEDNLRAHNTVNFDIAAPGVFDVSLKYSPSLSIDSVTANGMSEYDVNEEDSTIRLTLKKRFEGRLSVTIRSSQPFDSTAAGLETEIPRIVPLDVKRSSGTVHVGAIRHLDAVAVSEQSQDVRWKETESGAFVGQHRSISKWEYFRDTWKLVVRTSPRPAQLEAVVATTVRIDPDVARLNSSLRYTVRNAGVNTFRIAVPEAVAEGVRFTSDNSRYAIRQKQQSPAEDGWVTWTLTLQNDVSGSYQLNAAWETTLPQPEDNQERRLTIQPPRVLPPYDDDTQQARPVSLTQARGELRLLRHESLSLTADTATTGTEAIDVRELEHLPHRGYLAYRYFAQPASASIRIRQHEIHEVVATVVSRAAVEVVTEKQPLAAYRCRYRLTTSERQRLRVDVPAGSELQAPALNDRPTTFEPAEGVETESGWDTYFVNISRSGNSDESFLLSFQLRCPIADEDRRPYEGQGGIQLLRLPKLGDQSGTVVQETQAAIWTPDDVSIFGRPEFWTGQGRRQWSWWKPFQAPRTSAVVANLDHWLDDTSTTSEFSHQGHARLFRTLGHRSQVLVRWWNRPFMVAIVSGALLLMGLILRRTTWDNRISFAVVVATAITLWSLYDSDAAMQTASAAGPGLLAVAGIWLSRMLLGRNKWIPESPDPDNGGDKDDTTSPDNDPDDSGGDTPAPEEPLSAADIDQASPPESVPAADTPANESESSEDNTPSVPDNTRRATIPLADTPSTGSSVSGSDMNLPPGTVSPAPGVSDTINDLMGGRQG